MLINYITHGYLYVHVFSKQYPFTSDCFAYTDKFSWFKRIIKEIKIYKNEK